MPILPDLLRRDNMVACYLLVDVCGVDNDAFGQKHTKQSRVHQSRTYCHRDRMAGGRSFQTVAGRFRLPATTPPPCQPIFQECVELYLEQGRKLTAMVAAMAMKNPT
jgi:hypothetical protein